MEFKVLYETQISDKFIQGMIDRMMISYHKYGAVKDAFPEKVNALKCLELRLRQYRETGNTEFLMDVANYAMIEFMYPLRPNTYFKSTDSVDSPGRVWHGKYRPTKKANNE